MTHQVVHTTLYTHHNSSCFIVSMTVIISIVSMTVIISIVSMTVIISIVSMTVIINHCHTNNKAARVVMGI